jgi:hypothetical protein
VCTRSGITYIDVGRRRSVTSWQLTKSAAFANLDCSSKSIVFIRITKAIHRQGAKKGALGSERL